MRKELILILSLLQHLEKALRDLEPEGETAEFLDKAGDSVADAELCVQRAIGSLDFEE